MTDVATFLAAAVPWSSSGVHGYINIHSPFLRPGTTKAVMPGHAFLDFNNAVDNVTWRTRNGNDVYVCMSLQADAAPAKPGRRNRRAARSADKAVLLKAFWLDADLKVFGGDPVVLLAAFDAFRQAVGLPLPSFVNFTGGGFHFVWVLDEPITSDRWQPVADALAEACRRHGFKADHQCTANPAQLLRVPGTLNTKYTPARWSQIATTEALVQLVDMEGPLAAFRGPPRARPPAGYSGPSLSLPPGSRPAAAFGGMVLPGRLDAGLEVDWQPTMDEVAAVCPWFADALATGGANHREPEWREALRVAAHTKEGQETAHEVSGGHRDYTVQSTDAKYEIAARDAARYGWPQCQTIHNVGATQCITCPHLQQGRSPFNFVLAALQVAPAAPAASPPPAAAPVPVPIPGTSQTTPPAAPFWPDGYRDNPKTGCIEQFNTEAQVWSEIYPVPVRNFVLQSINEESSYGFEALCFEFDHAKKTRQARVRMSSVHDLRRFKADLSEQGMSFKDRQADNMARFMVSFVQQLRQAQHLNVECEPYGWSMKAGVEDGFTYDGMRFNCNGNRVVAPTDIALGRQYCRTGDLDVWKQACKLITDQQRPDLNAIIACGLGAPLVQMTGHNGFVVSAYSTHTGVQKSASMQVGQAMWGDAVLGMAGLDDTNNYLNKRLGMLRNLPLFVDELKFADDFRKAEIMVLGITQGKTKGRLSRASEAMETLAFNTMMITASNASLVQHIAEHSKTTTAGMARIFEFQVVPHKGVGIVDTTKASSAFGQLKYNYGGAGRVYAEYLGQHAPAVRGTVLGMCETINNIVKGTTDERFWVAAIAVLIAGANYGNMLGLTHIDTNHLSRFLLDQFGNQRRDSETSSSNIDVARNVERFVVDYINARAGSTIKTDFVNTRPGRAGAKPVVLNDANSIMNLRGTITVHLVRDQHIARVSLADFGRWLTKERGVSRSIVLQRIQELLPVSFTKVSLGRGTPYARAAEAVLEFDVALMPSIDLF